jgi:hypothetical protein
MHGATHIKIIKYKLRLRAPSLNYTGAVQITKFSHTCACSAITFMTEKDKLVC